MLYALSCIFCARHPCQQVKQHSRTSQYAVSYTETAIHRMPSTKGRGGICCMRSTSRGRRGAGWVSRMQASRSAYSTAAAACTGDAFAWHFMVSSHVQCPLQQAHSAELHLLLAAAKTLGYLSHCWHHIQSLIDPIQIPSMLSHAVLQ